MISPAGVPGRSAAAPVRAPPTSAKNPPRFPMRCRVAHRTLIGVLVIGCTSPAAAQTPGTLQDAFRQLFRFGDCGRDALFCLVNSSGSSAAGAFSTNANTTAQGLTLFVGSSITQGIANVPTPSTGSGIRFRLSPAGFPVPDEEKSSGPIFAE